MALLECKLSKNLTTSVVQVRDSIVYWKFDDPRSRVNSTSEQFFQDVEAILEWLEKNVDIIDGLIIYSGKVDNYFAGANLKLLQSFDEKAAASISACGQSCCRRLRELPFSTIAAVKGQCLGGGLEIVLATKYVIAVNGKNTVFGLPETQLGILPGACGSQYLPRRINVQEALTMMVTGKRLSAKQAEETGLIDQLIEPVDTGHDDTVRVMLEAATNAILSLRRNSIVLKRQSWYDYFLYKLMEYRVFRDIVLRKYRNQIMARGNGHYPAPLRLLDVVADGLQNGIESGLRSEQQAFVELSQTPQARSLIKLFVAHSEARKNKYGSTSNHDMSILVISDGDESRDIASLTKSTPISSNEISEHISDNCLIIDCSKEKEMKKKNLDIIESLNCSNVIYTSNSTHIPLNELYKNSKKPQNIVGMRYFAPASKTPLMEVVRTSHTSNEAVSMAVDIGLRQKKAVIVVNDGHGFFITRVFAMMAFEALTLMYEKEITSLRELEQMSKRMGFTVGITTMMDLIGLDVLLQLYVTYQAQSPLKLSGFNVQALRDLIQQGFMGKRSTFGLFNYDGDGKKLAIRPEAEVLILNNQSDQANNNLPSQSKQLNEREQRLLFIFINESVRCLEENTLASPIDGDLGSVLGLGFPPFMGGPFNFIDSQGADVLVDQMESLSSIYGKRFEPCQQLIDMARSEKIGKFYPSFQCD